MLPLYGELEPGETQKFQFTFYGHSHAMAEAAAVCSVHGGPDYRILLKGQASLLQYGFNTTKIDLGRQVCALFAPFFIFLSLVKFSV